VLLLLPLLVLVLLCLLVLPLLRWVHSCLM